MFPGSNFGPVSSMVPYRAAGFTDVGLLGDLRGHVECLIKTLVSHLGHSGGVTAFKGL